MLTAASWLYEYKSTNTALPVQTCKCCFTGPKVQVLTPQEIHVDSGLQAPGVVSKGMVRPSESTALI
jgi:hypothetical protein